MRELGVPFFTHVGHTGPLRPSDTGRPISHSEQVALDFPELVIVGGTSRDPWTEEMIAVARKHENVDIEPPRAPRGVTAGTGRLHAFHVRPPQGHVGEPP